MNNPDKKSSLITQKHYYLFYIFVTFTQLITDQNLLISLSSKLVFQPQFNLIIKLITSRPF